MPANKTRYSVWELGGDFHIPGASEIMSRKSSSIETAHWRNSSARFYGTGTGALLDLCDLGRRNLGWRRLHLPSYYCQSVVEAAGSTGLELKIYRDNPTIPADSLDIGCVGRSDAVVLVNYFGWRGKGFLEFSNSSCDIIEDHTHDPMGTWARSSRASYCFASLRKYFPMPDGAILWSPRGMMMPPLPRLDPSHIIGATQKMDGMALKSLYLGGASIEKKVFRRLLLDAESNIIKSAYTKSAPSASSMAIFRAISANRLIKSRKRNYGFLIKSGKLPPDWIIAPEIPKGCNPFSLVLMTRSVREREITREKLINHRVYPPILWENIPDWDDEGHMFSSRMLSIPCDHRYKKSDLVKLLDIFRKVYFKKND